METNKPILFQPWKAKAILDWDFEANGPMHTRRFTGLEYVNSYRGRVSYRGIEISDKYIHPKQKPHYRKFPHHWHWFLGKQGKLKNTTLPELHILSVKCPYGGAGDTLWGREAWRVASRSHFHADNYQRVTLEYAGQAGQGPLTKTFARPPGNGSPEMEIAP